MPRFRNSNLPAAQGPPPPEPPKTLKSPPNGHKTEETQATGSQSTSIPSLFPAEVDTQPAPSVLPKDESSAPISSTYQSIGCLKCGALDHIASNKNCPRPRKAPVATPAPKTPVTKAPKKPGNNNHQIKKAKLGDNTKFWYYKSEDSDSREESPAKNSEKRNPTKNEKGRTKASTCPKGSPKVSTTNKSRPTNRFTEQLTPSPSIFRATSHASRSTGAYDTPKIDRKINLSHGIIQEVTTDKKSLEVDNEFYSNDFEPTPSLPRIFPAAIASSSREETNIRSNYSPNNSSESQKRSFQSFIDEEEEIYNPNSTTPRPRVIKHGEFQTDRSTKDMEAHEIQHLRYSPQSSIQPTPNHSFLSQHTAQNPQNNREANQLSIKPSDEDKPPSGRIRYNYMGARNHIQWPRVRYAPDRVQGWRECRSMGTGLE